MRLHWLPVYIPTSAVAVYLCQFGLVKSISWDKTNIPSFESVLTSVRNIVLELDDGVQVPHIDNLKYKGDTHKLLITMSGRGPICFGCNKPGDTRSECQSVWCRHCYDWAGHSSEECSVKNSYASAARAGSSD